MVINDLYRMEDKQVETLFSFDEEVLKKALKNIYSKDFHPMTDIEENLFEATWKTMNKATDKGFGTRKTDDPDYDFYREIRMNNAVFAAFKVHRAQNDMAALLLDKNGSGTASARSHQRMKRRQRYRTKTGRTRHMTVWKTIREKTANCFQTNTPTLLKRIREQEKPWTH